MSKALVDSELLERAAAALCCEGWRAHDRHEIAAELRYAAASDVRDQHDRDSAELRRLCAELDDLQKKCAGLSDLVNQRNGECVRLRAEAEALRDAAKFASVVMEVVAGNNALTEVQRRSLLLELRRCDAALTTKGGEV